MSLLDDDQVVVFDGAMGTMLYSKGVPLNHCYDELCLSNPALVRDIHRQYIRAGAQVVETNSFGANRYKLAKHELNDKVAAINRRAVELARAEAAAALVAGAIGPLGLKIEPWGPTSIEEARDAFGEQAAALYEGGVDLFVLETFSDLNEIHQALQAVRGMCTLPVVAQMTVQEDCTSLYGTTPEVFCQRLDAWGADIIGINCSVGPHTMLATLERMVRVTHRTLSVQPNAGVPRNVEGRNIYLASPEYMAEYARRFILTGARVVGGCCGTTPVHIRAIANAVKALRPRRVVTSTTVLPREHAEIPAAAEVPRPRKSPLASRLSSGEFVYCVELVPPRGHLLAKLVDRARMLKDAGIDAVNIPDGPRASARMAPLALAVLLKNSVGMETILHYACRDRNLVGMQSDLIGAFALGLRNLLVVTGDPPKLGDYPDATAVFDVDSIGLTNMVRRLNRGLDLGGNSIGDPTAFHIGVGVNPGAVDVEFELRRFAYKVEAGAEFAITQPIYDPDLLETFVRRIGGFGIDLVAGIWPLVSLRNAEFMNNEVPGAKVPATVMERMARAETRGVAADEGVAIAREVLARIRPMIKGVQVAAPFGRIDLALAVLGRSPQHEG
ncbi:bifunctional homocysteine S-methyltransferase/methylenetetrahydrofolate reductase [Candidatus Fermentibacteria bacterium]|nr:bifunctional homocysteine S-methyltransferase/methylenetetrahydrofolate reductase [Candidatus Fermentibacteria bacterium]